MDGATDPDGARVIQRLLHQLLQLGKALGVVVANVLVHNAWKEKEKEMRHERGKNATERGAGRRAADSLCLMRDERARPLPISLLISTVRLFASTMSLYSGSCSTAPTISLSVSAAYLSMSLRIRRS